MAAFVSAGKTLIVICLLFELLPQPVVAPTISTATSIAPNRAKSVRVRMITGIPFSRTSLDDDPAAGAVERCLRLQFLRLATTPGVSTRGILLRGREGKQTATRFAGENAFPRPVDRSRSNAAGSRWPAS